MEDVGKVALFQVWRYILPNSQLSWKELEFKASVVTEQNCCGGMWGEREVVWSLLTIYFSQLWRKIIICLLPVSTAHCCSVFITVGFITLGPKVIFSFKNENKHFPGPLSVNLVFYTTPLPINGHFCLLSSFLASFLTPHSVSAHHLWRRTRSVGR